MRQKAVVLFLLAFVAVAPVAVGFAWSPPLAAQITPLDDDPEPDAPGLGNIVGSPEAGPEPEDAGDRGGWAQLALAVVLAGGVAFIGSRIVRGSRRTRADNISPNDPL